MSEIRLTAPPGRDALLAELEQRIRDVVPGWRLLARNVLGNEARIDFVFQSDQVAGLLQIHDTLLECSISHLFIQPNSDNWDNR